MILMTISRVSRVVDVYRILYTFPRGIY